MRNLEVGCGIHEEKDTAMDLAKHVNRDTAPSEGRVGRLTWIAGILMMVLVSVLWWFWPRALERDIRDLPVQERQAFVQRTVETLRTTCTHTKAPDLAEYCREQARLIAELEECDAGCRVLVRQFPRTLTR